MIPQTGHSYNPFLGSGSCQFYHLDLRVHTVSFQCFATSKYKWKPLSTWDTREKKAPLSWKHACLNHKRYSHIPKLYRNSFNFMPKITLKNNFNYVSHTAMRRTCGESVLSPKISRKEKCERHLCYKTHCPLVSSALLHYDIIGHSSYLMGPVTKTDDSLAQWTPSPPALSAKYSIRVSNRV